MLLQQKKKDFKQKQDILGQSLEEEIAEMNIVTNDEGDNDGMKKSREQVLAELCDSEDDYENSDSKSEEGDSLIDCDEWDEIIDDFKENEIS